MRFPLPENAIIIKDRIFQAAAAENIDMHGRFLRHVAAAVIVLASAPLGVAADNDSGFQLPSNPAKWVNSGPLGMEALEGKGAVLWFYEEGCPRCREKWPGLLALAKKYEGQPVVFIGVNSGNSRADVQHYAKAVGCNWPIIVDDTREFEQQCGIDTPISLMNIYQVGYISPSGQFRRGNFNELDQTVESALKGASWKVEPQGIPASLKSAWLAIEFGNPAVAAPAIKKALGKVDTKEAAGKLNEVVQTEIAKLATEADEQAQAGNKWAAFKTYQTMAALYGGYDVPADAKTKAKELGTDEEVKKQLLAQKGLEAAMKSGASARSASARKAAINKLKNIPDNFPGTDAALEAQKVLAQLGEGM